MFDWFKAKKNIAGAKKARKKGDMKKARSKAEKAYNAAAKSSNKRNKRRGWL